MILLTNAFLDVQSLEIFVDLSQYLQIFLLPYPHLGLGLLTHRLWVCVQGRYKICNVYVI